MGSMYDKPKAGEEWEVPEDGKLKIACCDCGLVHKFEFKVVKGTIYAKAWRDNRATAQKRRHKNVQ